MEGILRKGGGARRRAEGGQVRGLGRVRGPEPFVRPEGALTRIYRLWIAQGNND